MDDFLNKESEDQQPGSGNDGRKRIDSIPLWLQGISENNADSEIPADEGEWLKEQAFVSTEETGPVSIEITDQILPEEELQDEPEPPATEAQSGFQRNLANWFKEDDPVEEIEETEEIEELEPVEEISDITNVDLDDSALEETTEDTQFKTAEIEEEPTADLPIAEITPVMALDGGFEEIEFSGLNADDANALQEEILPEAEEIPDWLRDMIAADEKQQRKKEQQAAFAEEPTQPVVVQPIPVPQDQVVEEPIETVEEELAESDPIPEEKTAAPEFNPRSAVMPSANWSRITGTPSEKANQPSAEDDANEEEPADAFTLDSPEAPSFDPEPDLPKDDSADFEGSGFQPIQFDPSPLEIEDPQDDDVHFVENITVEPSQEEASEPFSPSWSDEVQPEETTEDEPPEQAATALEDWGQPAPAEDLETTLPVHTFSPMEITPEDPEPDPLPLEMINGVPASLFQAKQILEQGQINQAMVVFKPYISRSEYLDEIKQWLLSVDEKFEKNKASLWEALGDISSHQGDYSAALSAYAKAIELLELARNKLA